MVDRSHLREELVHIVQENFGIVVVDEVHVDTMLPHQCECSNEV